MTRDFINVFKNELEYYCEMIHFYVFKNFYVQPVKYNKKHVFLIEFITGTCMRYVTVKKKYFAIPARTQ